MQKTSIEWVKNPDGSQGFTFNPITGCLNNCPYCYARKLANTRLKERYLGNNTIAPVPEPISLKKVGEHLQDPFYPRFWPSKLEQPFTAKPKGIFTCDMSDLFGIGIPEEWTKQILQVIKIAQHHRFYLLTKQPHNLQKFSPFPDNAWVGVSVTDTKMFIQAGLYLSNIEATVKYVSIEPLLDWQHGTERSGTGYVGGWLQRMGIKWVIIGAQTGSLNDLVAKKAKAQPKDLTLMPYGKKWTLQPKIEWVREIVEACNKAGVKVFLKDNLKPLLDERWPFSNSNFMRNGLVRQELPQ